MKQRFTALLLARIRQLFCGTPIPPLPAKTSSPEDASTLDFEAMMKGIKEEPASLEVQMEDAEKAMGDFDAVMQEMLDEWHNPNLSDEARSILKGLIEGSIRELSNFQAKASEDIESSRREFPIAESPPPAEIPQPDAAGLFRPIKRHYFSTPDHSSASTSPAEQRADRRPGR